MATTSPLQGVPLPEDTDPDRVPYDLAQAVGALEKLSVQFYSSASARDTKLSPPSRGMIAYLNDRNAWTAYNGTAWVDVLLSGMAFQASGAGVVPLVVQGAANQSAHLADFRDSNGASLAYVGASGDVHAASLSASGAVSGASLSVTGTVSASGGWSGSLAVSGDVTPTGNLLVRGSDSYLAHSGSGSGRIRVTDDGSNAYFQTDRPLLFSPVGSAAWTLAHGVNDVNGFPAALTVKANSNGYSRLIEFQNTSGTATGGILQDGSFTGPAVMVPTTYFSDYGSDIGASTTDKGILFMHNGALKYRAPGIYGTLTTIAPA